MRRDLRLRDAHRDVDLFGQGAKRGQEPRAVDREALGGTSEHEPPRSLPDSRVPRRRPQGLVEAADEPRHLADGEVVGKGRLAGAAETDPGLELAPDAHVVDDVERLGDARPGPEGAPRRDDVPLPARERHRPRKEGADTAADLRPRAVAREAADIDPADPRPARELAAAREEEDAGGDDDPDGDGDEAEEGELQPWRAAAGTVVGGRWRNRVGQHGARADVILGSNLTMPRGVAVPAPRLRDDTRQGARVREVECGR